MQGAKLLAERGVDVVDINDGSLGRVRMAVLPTALLVREATGLDISMHFTCRDRNLMGIQGDLLGAHALGRPEHPGDDRGSPACRRLRQRHRRLRRRRHRTGPDRRGHEPGRGRVWQLDRRADRIRDRRRRGSRRGRPGPGDRPAPRQGGRWRDVGPDAAGLRSRAARRVPRAARRRPGAPGRRHPAAPLVPPRRVPAQRGAGHHGPRTPSVRGSATRATTRSGSASRRPRRSSRRCADSTPAPTSCRPSGASRSSPRSSRPCVDRPRRQPGPPGAARCGLAS